MKQSLALDRSCQRAVDAWAGQRAAEGLSVQSIRTGGYCRARARLPLGMIVAMTRETGPLAQCPSAARLAAGAVAAWKLADGTGISMPDTSENQARYPNHAVRRLEWAFHWQDLWDRVSVDRGGAGGYDRSARKQGAERARPVSQPARQRCVRGDILLADALYCSYFQIATLQAAGVDVLFEQHGSRITDFRRGHSLGKRDHLVRWMKPETRPGWMSLEQYRAFPKEILVREAKVDGQVLGDHDAKYP